MPSISTTKVSMAHRTSSQDSTSDGIRKRVCKACDRCRLKKSKCDGSSPCTRCRADNAICVFGERKKTHDKVYPKGYVEMLEQQQAQLVNGLQELYRRLQATHNWDGASLPENNGHPLTHDILAALNLLETRQDGGVFEEDVSKIQARLLAEGNEYTQRRSSISSDSEHSQHEIRSSIASPPTLSRANVFRDSFAFDSNTTSPLVESPLPQHPQFATQQPTLAPTFQDDPSLYAPEWAQALSEAVARQKQQLVTSQMQTVDELEATQWPMLNYAGMLNMDAMQQYTNMQSIQDMTAIDSMGLDFDKFVPGYYT